MYPEMIIESALVSTVKKKLSQKLSFFYISLGNMGRYSKFLECLICRNVKLYIHLAVDVNAKPVEWEL